MAETSSGAGATSPAGPGAPAPPWARALVALLLLVPMGLAVDSLRQKSWTWDEPIYLAGGHYLLRTGNLRNPALSYHPPLVQYWNSLGLLPLRLPARLFPSAPADYDWDVGMQVAFASGHDPDRVRVLARLPFVCLIPVLGALVYRWSRALWGWPGGLLSLWLVTWNPTLLAHARLVATDYLFTVLLVAGLWAGRHLIRRGGLRRIVQTGALVGLAFLAKFTAVILVPCAALGGWLATRAGRGSAANPAGPAESSSAGWRRWPASRVVAGLAGLVLVAALVLWLGYLGEYALGITSPAERAALRDMAPPTGLVDRLMYALYVGDVRLPAMTYVMGFFSQFSHGAGGHSNYLFGRVATHGWWYYFPAALLVKTPLPELGAWLVGAFAWGRAGGTRRDAAWLGVAPVVLLLLSARANINIGVRHVLPLYPLGAVAAGACAAGMAHRWGRLALGIGAVWLLAAAMRVHPHYLTYFNPLAGGPAGGHRALVDSNLDWGQDVDALFARAQAEGWLPMRVQYFGPPRRLEFAPPGFEAWADPCVPATGYLAVSVTNRVGAYMPNGGACFAWLDAYEPIARINHTIWVYDIPEDADGSNAT